MDDQMASTPIGLVVIGRNEGERLKRCLESCGRTDATVVYVDSGSTDGSVALARSMGVYVVELDMSIPFCAARARNEGFVKLRNASPQVRFVQFVDGDCELIHNWIPFGVATLQSSPSVAIVAGWLHERFPEASIYNRLAEIEWNFSGIGAVDSVGGIFMIKREAFEEVGGFDPTVAAGEEPELCQRLASRGWKFVRIDRDMAWHDLAMRHFGQWWTRMVRFGYGSLDVANRFHLKRFRSNNFRIWVWSVWLFLSLFGALPVIAISLDGLIMATAWVLLSLWPAQLIRIAIRTWKNGQPPDLAAAYAFFLMISHWPQLFGVLLWQIDHQKNKNNRFRLIEYKSSVITMSRHDGSVDSK